MFNRIGRTFVRNVREGEGTGTGTGTGTAGTGTGTGNPNPGTNNPTGGVKTFTQEEVNRLIAEDKRKLADKNRELVTQLEQLQGSAKLTQEQKDELAQRIEELQQTYQTKEEQAKTELQKATDKYNADKTKWEKNANDWKGRFENQLIDTDLTTAAANYKAFNVEQVKAILRPITKSVEEIGEDGKPTGRYISRVDFMGKDKDGKPVKLQLSAMDAVKAMVEMPESYGNLFCNETNSGISMAPVNRGNGDVVPDLENMSPQDYAKYRDKVHAEMRRNNQ